MRERLMRRIHSVVVLGISLAMCAGSVRAQDVAETALATSNSSTMAHGMKAPSIMAKFPRSSASPTKANTQAYMIAPSGPPIDQVNRKDFEDNAGPNAGKLLLRSIPTGADIFINDKLVGKTPMLMVVAPGKYKISMRGARQDDGEKVIGLMPKETQMVVITLKEKYPSEIVIR
jgi:PEGA domain